MYGKGIVLERSLVLPAVPKLSHESISGVYMQSPGPRKINLFTFSSLKAADKTNISSYLLQHCNIHVTRDLLPNVHSSFLHLIQKLQHVCSP